MYYSRQFISGKLTKLDGHNATASLLLLLAVIAPVFADIPLAKDGKALVKIVRPSEPIPAENRAVTELTNYLFKITGAGFEVVSEKDMTAGAAAIYVGPTDYAKKQGYETDKLDSEESVIRTIDSNLVITGGRPRGTLYAVYIFLEETLGVRWYTPWMEKVPAQPACKIGALDIRRKPWFEMRDYLGVPFNVADTVRLYGENWSWWIQRNRLNGPAMGEGSWYKTKYDFSPIREETGGGWVLGGPHNHSFAWFFPPDKYFKDHPEYYSMRKGKRVAGNGQDGNHLCLSNKDVQRLMKEKVLERFRKISNANIVSVSQNDGGIPTLCDCPECSEFVKKHGNETDLMMAFVNPIAEAVEKEFPGKYVGVLGGYQPIGSPPLTIKPRDNVVITYGGGRWTQKAKRVWTWNLYSNAFVSSGFNRPQWWRIAESLKQQKRDGVTGIFAESEMINMEPFLGEMYELRMWIFPKLTENPDLDVDELIKDFMGGYAGNAGPFLVEYMMLKKERLPFWPWRFVDCDYLIAAQKLFDQAEDAVKDKPEFLARVKEMRIPLDLTTLVWRNKALGDFIRSGGKPADYPFNSMLLRDRMIKTIKATTHPYWRWKEPATMWLMGQYRKGLLCDYAVEFLERLYPREMPYAPWPEALRASAPEIVIEIPSGAFTGAGHLLEFDPEAAQGIAYRCSWKNLPFEYGAYDQSSAFLTEPRLIGQQDVKGPGYYAYQGGRFTVGPQTLLYMPSSWEYQVCLKNFLDPRSLDESTRNQVWARPGQVFDWYVSLKVKKTDKGEDALIDRVFLVDQGMLTPSMHMLARWPLDGDGSEWAPPGSGESNAEIKGGTWVSGRFGKALALIQASDMVFMPYNDPARTSLRERLNFSAKSFTVSLWFRTDSREKDQTLFEQKADENHFLSLQIDGPKSLTLRTFDPKTNKPVSVTIKSSLADNQWHHVTFGYDRDTRQMFLTADNEKPQTATVSKIPVIEAPIRLGSGAAGFLHGALDEITIYDIAAPGLQGGAAK